ncbi:MAG: L-serine ammonia-lyase [Microbacterium sp.]
MIRRGAYVSALELFSIGIGPSSSHTVGPMRAGFAFAHEVLRALNNPVRVEATLYGSLAATGLGHGTPDALVAGLAGGEPETCDPDAVRGAWSEHPNGAPLILGGVTPIPFSTTDVAFDRRTKNLPHPNTLTLRAWADGDADPAFEATYLSIGGGFIVRAGEEEAAATPAIEGAPVFTTAAELLVLCADGASIADIAWQAERAARPAEEVEAGLDRIWMAMRACIEAGLHTEGTLPGILHVPRRAPSVRRRIEESASRMPDEWLQAFALAVNEENAAGGRVVTAPTNGAAGILPAVLYHWWLRTPGAAEREIREFLLTATAIGSLLKANASISGAEGGCQAEVGSACAMAAAGLCAVMGGTPSQVENAAEIAVEHHLGLTCDPVGGLVQIPCIERNAVAASTAMTAARLALAGDGTHIVSLDAVVETMRQTGADMKSKYKETSRGGLAVNVVEC